MNEIDINRFFEAGISGDFHLFVVCHTSRMRTLENMVEGDLRYHVMGHTSQGLDICSLFQSLEAAHRYMESLGKASRGGLS